MMMMMIDDEVRCCLEAEGKVKGEEKKVRERRRKRGKCKGREECVLVVGEIVSWWVGGTDAPD